MSKLGSGTKKKALAFLALHRTACNSGHCDGLVSDLALVRFECASPAKERNGTLQILNQPASIKQR